VKYIGFKPIHQGLISWKFKSYVPLKGQSLVLVTNQSSIVWKCCRVFFY